MKYITLILMSVLVMSGCSMSTSTQTDTSSDDNHMQMPAMDHSDADEMEPMDIKDKLSESPRHQEWIEIDNNGKTIYTFVVYPEVNDGASAVVLIHENKGLTDWVRSLADEIASDGYIVLAPDLLSEYSTEKQRTSDFETQDDATQALYTLDGDQVKSDIQAVTEYAQSIEAFDGSLVTAGFCWGGSRSYEMATVSDDIDAALVFYGTAPESADVYADIDVPVYGFYGGADERVNATIQQTQQYMTDHEKTYDYVIYEGAGHAFMRTGEGDNADPANATARSEAYARMLDILSDLEQ